MEKEIQLRTKFKSEIKTSLIIMKKEISQVLFSKQLIILSMVMLIFDFIIISGLILLQSGYFSLLTDRMDIPPQDNEIGWLLSFSVGTFIGVPLLLFSVYFGSILGKEIKTGEFRLLCSTHHFRSTYLISKSFSGVILSLIFLSIGFFPVLIGTMLIFSSFYLNTNIIASISFSILRTYLVLLIVGMFFVSLGLGLGLLTRSSTSSTIIAIFLNIMIPIFTTLFVTNLKEAKILQNLSFSYNIEALGNWIIDPYFSSSFSFPTNQGLISLILFILTSLILYIGSSIYLNNIDLD